MSVQSALSRLTAATDAWNRRDVDAVRVQLDAFWKEKASAWTSDPGTQATLNLMDADAHSIWARLEDLLAVRAETGSVEREAHVKASQDAWNKSAALRAAGNASQRSVQQALTNAQAMTGAAAFYNQTIPDASYSAALKSQTEKLLTTDILGVPSWVWLGGGALILFVLLARD